jgi:hypothetical protein
MSRSVHKGVDPARQDSAAWNFPNSNRGPRGPDYRGVIFKALADDPRTPMHIRIGSMSPTD